MTTGSIGEREPATRATKRRLTWGVVFFQFVFGLLWFGTASVLTGEPALSLDRGENGEVGLEYSLHLYGVIPARHVRMEDVSDDYRLSTSLADVSRGDDDTRGVGTQGAFTVQTHHWITFSNRAGTDSVRLPGVFDIASIGGFFDSDDETYRERYAAGPARKYGMGALGAFGGLVFVGGLWNTLRLGLFRAGVIGRPDLPS